jgi:hypothetical protein
MESSANVQRASIGQKKQMTEIIKIKPGKAEIGDPGLNESFKQWVKNNEYWTNLKYAKIFLDNMGLEYKIVENSDK